MGGGVDWEFFGPYCQPLWFPSPPPPISAWQAASAPDVEEESGAGDGTGWGLRHARLLARLRKEEPLRPGEIGGRVAFGLRLAGGVGPLWMVAKSASRTT